MADSRNKGATFERDIVKRINAFADQHTLGFQCKRNLDQYQTADLCDIQIPRHSIECKAYKSGWWYAPAWWDQVCAACGDNTPVLIYKFNNKAIRVCLPLYAINENMARDNSRTAVITLDEWFDLLKESFDGQREAA
jgi:hypothetical protein|tara:strand:- start:155 stop:565 length:411 start_codon:yes stop_codon:yes gene_type:complete